MLNIHHTKLKIASRLLVVFSFIIIFLGFDFFPARTTDPSKYVDLYEKWKDSGLLNHFPKRIPQKSHNVKLSALPKFLQGGGHFQIRYNLPKKDLNQLMDRYQTMAKAFYDGGDKYKLINSNKGGGLPGTSFYTSGDDKIYEFPEDYRIFIIDAKPYRENNWNHGNSYGAVISIEKQEIIYYAESW